MNLVAGDYVLTVIGYGLSTGPYSFRMLDMSAAVPVTPARRSPIITQSRQLDERLQLHGTAAISSAST